MFLLGLMTSLGALIRATHNPESASLCQPLVKCLESSLFQSNIFVLDMGMRVLLGGTIHVSLVGLVILWSQLKLLIRNRLWFR